MRTRIGRRAMLKGAVATCLGLPRLEAMLDGNGLAYADGTPLGSRLVLFFCPTSLRPSSSNQAEGMTPTRAGFGYDLPTCLQPLTEAGVAGDVSAISGLFAPPTNAPGGYKSDYHSYGIRSVLSGARHGFGEPYTLSGPTVDQVVAEAVGAQTTFPSLVFQIDPVRGNGVSAQTRTGGRFGIVQAQVSPAQAYRSLVTNLPSQVPDPAGNLEKRLRASSLSFARDQITALSARVGAADKQRLDQHFTQLRDLETRLLAAPAATMTTTCKPLAQAPVDPANVGAAPDQDRRASHWVDLIALAVACDSTRSIVLLGADRLTETGMLHDRWKHLGGLHAHVQHGNSNAELDKANRWFVVHYAQIVARCKQIQQGTGTALDTSAIAFVMEGGKAGRAADGGGDANHSTDNMLMLLAGRAGGLKPGQHVIAKDRHPAAVLNTALHAIGVARELGEIKGHIDQLFSAA